MKKSHYIKILILFFISIQVSYAVGVGSVVYDPTNATNMAAQLEQLKTSVEHQARMAEAIGKGDFNPSVINYLDNLYSGCGGKKYGLPDWFPKFAIAQICADENSLIEPVVKFYKDNMLPLTTDTSKQMQEKRQYQLENSAKVRGYALGKSQISLDQMPTTSEKIKNLHDSSTAATTQFELQKIQLQVSMAILEELQKSNESQALIIQMLGWKN